MRNNQRRIKIGYKEYVLKFVKKIDDQDGQGECTTIWWSNHDHPTGTIRIKKGQAGVEKANTILHEIGHAIIASQSPKISDKLEEHIVNSFTNGLVAFIKDNPKFFSQIVDLINNG